MSIKLQTTIVTTREDWSVARFELLVNISRQKNAGIGRRLFATTTCERGPLEAAEPVLSLLDRGDFDALWLSTIDRRAGFGQKDCVGVSEFWPVQIDWPNGHSGVEQAKGAGNTHRSIGVDVWSPIHVVQFLPSLRPLVGVHGLEDGDARVPAREGRTGTGGSFNPAVAFERSRSSGRFIADCGLHRFADEPARDGDLREPAAAVPVCVYVRNVATWLALLESDECEGLAFIALRAAGRRD